MKPIFPKVIFAITLGASLGVAHADSSRDTIELFKNAGQSAAFFDNSYAYAALRDPMSF